MKYANYDALLAEYENEKPLALAARQLAQRRGEPISHEAAYTWALWVKRVAPREIVERQNAVYIGVITNNGDRLVNGYHFFGVDIMEKRTGSVNPIGMRPGAIDHGIVVIRNLNGVFGVAMKQLWIVEASRNVVVGDLNEIGDWFISLPESRQLGIRGMTFAQAKTASDRWHANIAKRKNARTKHLLKSPPLGEDADNRIESGDGKYWVRLLTKDALEQEGARMHHCVGGYSGYVGEHIRKAPEGIWSLRDDDGAKSLLTAEIGEGRPFHGKDQLVLRQVKSVCNGSVPSELDGHVVKLVKASGAFSWHWVERLKGQAA